MDDVPLKDPIPLNGTRLIIAAKYTSIQPSAIDIHRNIVEYVNFEKNSRLLYIDSNTFENCSRLKEVSFRNCSYIKAFHSNSFRNCTNLIKVDIQSNYILTIDDYAFYDCVSLKTFHFQQLLDLDYIGKYAFANCKSLDEFVTSFFSYLNFIDIGAFENCSKLEIVNSYSSVLEISKNTFANCISLVNVFIFSSKNIPDYAFLNCISLATVVFAEFSSKISKYSFFGCYELKNVQFTSCYTYNSDNLNLGSFISLENFLIHTDYKLTKITNTTFIGCSKLKTIEMYIMT